jgi:single-strand DNA-binding protein
MSVRSLNRALLIGNLTKDPELRYTPNGVAVCSFSIATNRGWTTESGEKKEETEFHRIVAWNKLAELCSQLLTKGRKVFVEGRLQTRSWQTQEGAQRQSTEIVIDDMIILDSRKFTEGSETTAPKTFAQAAPVASPAPVVESAPTAATISQPSAAESDVKQDVNLDDIPF